MKNALIKDTFREIKNTFGRFFSIFLIVAIGVSIFAGVKATAPDMKITADKYFDEYNFMDIRLISTMGFNDKDIEAIKKVEGLEEISPTYSMDSLVTVNNNDKVLKVLAMPSNINKVKLIEGRLPQGANEAVTEKGKMMNSSLSLGTKVKLSSGTDKDISESLETNEFTIVGIVETPYYISTERGTTSIANGKINSFIMIPEENFKLSVFTDVLLTVKGVKELLSFEGEYDKVIKPIKDSLEAVGESREQGRFDEILAEATEKINGSKEELREAEEKQKIELSSALQELEDARRKISDGEKELKNKETQYNKTIIDAEAKINNGYKELEKGEGEYAISLAKFIETKKQAEQGFTQAESQLSSTEKELFKKESEVNAAKLALTSPGLSQAEKAQMEYAIKTAEQQLASGKAQLSAAKLELEAKKKELSEGEATLNSAREQLDANKVRLNSEKKKLEDGKKKAQTEFAVARRKIEESKIDVEKGQQDYDKGKKESDEKIAEGYTKIADAEKELSELEKPKWYVLDRDMNADFVGYEKAADRIDAIAEVFPVFFFIVAALVCLTTMTRMVDEQRGYIGTLKALGYSKISIASKYLLYAMFASLGGSIIGLLVGFKVFPTVIFNAYGILYTLPPVITEFNIYYAMISILAAVLATTAAAWFSCYKELMIMPSVLMRPKAPKAGKRILLERITFIWSRLNFTQKVSARNLFRYKKRFFMTVLGIGGCTALLLAGFGLKDSILDMVSKQFNELYQYDMLIGLKEHKTIDISKEIRISDYMLIREQSIDIGTEKDEESVTLFVPEDKNKLQEFIILRDRASKDKVVLEDDGVLLTEKVAKLLGVKAGEEIYIKDGDTKRINVRVADITENYVSHFIYMSPKLYEEVSKEKVEYKQIIAKATDTSESFENKLSSDLLKNDSVSSVSFTTGVSRSFNETVVSLNYVVLVLIISAGALAFVVLYNLTNVNITERLREIATIKVLGFYDNEVASYVYRENIMLTVIGMIFGLVLGIFLHKYIILTTEIDMIMFSRGIKPLSFVYSALLTLIFSGLVNYAMYFKLRKISMVESLKSVD
jgi:putative ABC transport system permease protein